MSAKGSWSAAERTLGGARAAWWLALVGVLVGLLAPSAATAYQYEDAVWAVPGSTGTTARAVAGAPSGEVFAAASDDRLYRYSAAGVVLGSYSQAEGKPFRVIADVALDSNGTLVLADEFNSRVVRMRQDGQVINSWKVSEAMSVDTVGTDVVVAGGRRGVERFHADGSSALQYVGAGGAHGVAVDQLGTTYAAILGLGLPNIGQIWKFDPAGALALRWPIGAPGSAVGRFGPYGPGGLSIDSAGYVWAADGSNLRIQRFSPLARTVSVCGPDLGLRKGSFISPTDVDARQSNLYVADGHFIRRFRYTRVGAIACDGPPRLSAGSFRPQTLRQSRSFALSGAHLSYVTSSAGTVRAVVARRMPGARQGSRCLAGTSGPPCIRLGTVGVLSSSALRGRNDLHLTRRVSGHYLSAGWYQASIYVTDGLGRRSPSAIRIFRVP